MVNIIAKTPFHFGQHLNVLYKFIDESLLDALREGYSENLEFIRRSIWVDYLSWYIKLKSRLGVYEILLVDYGIVKTIPAADIRLPLPRYMVECLLLRYYPNPKEEYFKNFSYYERKFRLKENFFTEDGIPSSKARMEMPKQFFTIGELDYYVEFIKRGDIRLSLRSQKYYVEKRADGIKENSKTIIKPGEVDRNVPGWDISWELYKSLLKTYVKYFKGEILLALEIEKPGKIYTTKGGNVVKEETSWDNAEKYVEVGLKINPKVTVDYRAYMYIYKYYSELSKNEGYVFKNLMFKRKIHKLLGLEDAKYSQ
ncbi:MAG: hypothetical protein DRN04_11305 [Thermoprotei archaeon]|nr:MAG: hypothetical protein DRN04_11305 [Thermoprotei archaeon]